MELALGGYAGFHTTTPPTAESAYGVYRPAAVLRAAVTHTVVLPDGTRQVIPDPPPTPPTRRVALPGGSSWQNVQATTVPDPPSRPTVRAALGAVVGARSGDKGGNANIGLWTRTDDAYAWLAGFLTVERVRELLGPEVADLPVEVFALPNLRALNVVVSGLLGDGVASSTRPDPQAKGLGEYLRSRVVDVPPTLL